MRDFPFLFLLLKDARPRYRRRVTPSVRSLAVDLKLLCLYAKEKAAHEAENADEIADIEYHLNEHHRDVPGDTSEDAAMLREWPFDPTPVVHLKWKVSNPSPNTAATLRVAAYVGRASNTRELRDAEDLLAAYNHYQLTPRTQDEMGQGWSD